MASEPSTPILAEARAALRTDPARTIALLAPFPHAPPHVLRLLASAHRALAQDGAAAQLDRRIVDEQSRAPAMLHAIRLFAAGREREAERDLRAALRNDPDNVPALCLLAQLAQQAGIFGDAEKLLRRALAVTPAFADAQRTLAQVLFSRNDVDDALALLDQVLAADPADADAIAIKLRILGQTGDYDQALALYECMLERDDSANRSWIGYANVLKTVGRAAESAAAFRRAIAIAPDAGDGWWGLADLKVAAFDPAEVAAMQTLSARADLTDDARVKIGFALAKALDDRQDYQSAFDHYRRANALHRSRLGYDAAATTREVDRAVTLFTADFFAARRGAGSADTDPIFIVGMPRAGSTLVEQILASHPLVEGTSELPDIPLLLQGILAERWQGPSIDIAAAIAALPHDAFARLGDAYLAATRRHRKTDRPFFIDKLPNNWLYTGFIHLILPNACIIDARRDALACGFANFTQYFAQGQAFAYDLADMGRYYRDYARLMRHFDAVLPRRVRRVDHARLTAAPDAEIADLLADLGLPFDPRCLKFHENPRPVRTASAEQVRRPIARTADDRWRPYERWLEPLKHALGD